jgi:YVTN family beta-propeller protein
MSDDARIGTTLAGYRIESLIGRGGMSVVYLAEQDFPKRKVALKILATDLAKDPKFRERFVRESNLAASIEHPNIIPIYGAGEADGLLYIAMRYIGGGDLKALIQNEGHLPPERAMSIVGQVAGALDAAHAAGLVHRDVKPSNILLGVRASPSSPDHAYLSDFGLTKRVLSDSGITGTGVFVGTLDYAAPEQFEGKTLDGRTDVYSLGCVLFECLTGELPYQRDQDAALMYAHLMAPPPTVTERRPELPKAIDGVIAKAMAKAPGDRYATAGELVAAARKALDLSSGEHAVVPPEPAPNRRFGWASIGAAALAVLIAIVVLFVMLASKSKEPTAGSGTPTASGQGSPSPSTPVAAPGSGQLVRIDLATRSVSASIPVGSHPAGVAVGEGSVWVTNAGDGTVSRIDPVSNAVTATIPVGRGPEGIAVGEGAVWVANRFSNTVSRIDPATNGVISISVDSPPGDVGVGDGTVWAVGHAQCTDRFATPVYRIDPATDRAVASLEVDGCNLVQGSEGVGAMWTVTDNGYLTRIDLQTSLAVKSTQLNRSLAGIVIGDGAIWVSTTGFPGVVLRIDPETTGVEATIPGGGSADADISVGIALDAQMVWVIDRNNGVVSPIVVSGNDAQRPVEVGKDPTAVADGLGAVWVTVVQP